eukprot:8958-Heterococcus_DN1.PRE.2
MTRNEMLSSTVCCQSLTRNSSCSLVCLNTADATGNVVLNNGEPVYKKRKPSTKAPELTKLADRILKKCDVDTSNWGDAK